MKKIIITGAYGYIDKCLFHFLKNKFKVVGIDEDESFVGWKAKNSNLNKIVRDEMKWIKNFSKNDYIRKFKNYLK